MGNCVSKKGVPQEEQVQQQPQFYISQGGFFNPQQVQQQFIQQQVNPQQNYPHDISKQLNNQQLAQGQALAQQQNMYQQQPQQRTPAPFYPQRPMQPPQQQRMPMPGQGQSPMYPTVMFMPPSTNMNSYGTQIIVQSQPGGQMQPMMLPGGQRMPAPQPPYNMSAPQTVSSGGYSGMPPTSYQNTMTMYQVPTQRPPSTPGMTAPQPVIQKRERKILSIVDPNTGKDIISDVMSARSTTPGSTGSGSRGQTPNESIEEGGTSPPQGEASAICAQFAAQVAATMRSGGGGQHPTQMLSTEGPPPGVQLQPLVQTAPVVEPQSQPPIVTEGDTTNSIPQQPIVNTHVSAVQLPVENTPSLSSSESNVHSQNNVEVVEATRTKSETPETISSVDSLSNVQTNGISEGSSREPSQELVSGSEDINAVDINVPTQVEEKVETKVISEPSKTKSEESVVKIEDKKQNPVVKSEENMLIQEVGKEESSSVDPVPDPKAVGEPASVTETVVARESKKESTKKKLKDLNKKEMDGSDMDAFIDVEHVKEEITPVEEKPVEQKPPQEKPEEDKTKKESVQEVSVEVPTVEIIVEDEKVQEENAKNREISESDADADAESDPSMKLKYTYKEDQWSPLNMEGKKLYDREFLLQLQFSQESTAKPKDLPDLPDIILDNPLLGGTARSSRDNFSFSASQSSGFDFTPGYVKGTPSRGGGGGGGSITKRNSQQSHKRIPDRPSAQKVINLSSMQQEVKLHKAESAWKPTHKDTKEVKDEDELKTEELYKKARGILNKLTPQKFQTLVKQMSELEITSEDHLQGVANLVFEKAIAEPGFSVAYASMCRYLTQIKVPSTKKSGEFVNFRAILLTKCQKEFEKDKAAEDDIEQLRIKLKDAEESKKAEIEAEIVVTETNARRRSLGNIRFIGELFKLKMLTEPIMHECVFKLLNSKDEESLECLCKLLRTIGKELDSEKAKPRVDQYFQRMNKVVEEKKTSSRVRFMLQDVVELRHSNWVPRRDESNPKTIEQIHKEAQQEAQEKQLLVQSLAVQSKSGGRGGGRGGGGPRLGGQSGSMGGGATPDGWSTVAGPPSRRGERQTIDPARLKLSRQNVDENIQLGPGGGAGRFAGWQRGSSGGGARTSQEAEKTPGNRFSALSKPEEEGRSRYGVSPARDGGRGGRGFGRPVRISQRSSQEQEKESALAAARSIAGGQTTPREGPSRESSRGREPRESSLKEPEKPVEASVQLTEAEMVKKAHAILDEYLHLQDMKEALICVEELNCPSINHVFVSECINQVLERSTVARRHTGLLLHDLVKKPIITDKQYLQGLNSVLAYAEDMEIDIPKIYQYFGELIGPMVQDGSVPLSFLKEACQPLKETGKAGILVAEILHDASDREGHKKVGDLWRKSGLEWSDFVPEDQITQFLKDKKLEFTTRDGSTPTTPTVRMPLERIQDNLHDLVVEKAVRNEEIFDWIEANLDDFTTKDKKFIRALMTAVCSSAITGRGNSAKVDATRITARGVILQKYLDHQAEFELQALYALQALVHKLEHPPGVLRTLFDTLYDEDIISEDAFNQWEASKDPAEQEGKGVAMKQVVQFFTWLREADDEVDS
ncbi:eukaryotic translation initiation factor 4 gamma 1-like isoform X1 [Mytilus californianus]|uniref:eukaryotic translation initiation factor 4 gamma 1-like isoform X1 n=2 Tax=Mytilus californianus TaxID=6549 RepID=UPI0022465E29|nr:eukaryotic translation initiation factor 4 gamma 1-like isoform X1 [Mytilus californianus]